MIVYLCSSLSVYACVSILLTTHSIDNTNIWAWKFTHHIYLKNRSHCPTIQHSSCSLASSCINCSLKQSFTKTCCSLEYKLLFRFLSGLTGVALNTGVSSEHWNYQISEVLIDGEAYFHIATLPSGIRNVTLMCLSLCICKILYFFSV